MIFRKSSGWSWCGFLLGAYALLKILGWWYGLQAQRLENQLEDLRPTLAAIARYEYLENTRQPYLKAIHQLKQQDLSGAELLSQLSQTAPPSLAFQELQWKPSAGLLIRGLCLAGTRNPEAVVTLWAEKLRSAGYGGGVIQLAPDLKNPGVWYFELNSGDTP